VTWWCEGTGRVKPECTLSYAVAAFPKRHSPYRLHGVRSRPRGMVPAILPAEEVPWTSP